MGGRLCRRVVFASPKGKRKRFQRVVVLPVEPLHGRVQRVQRGRWRPTDDEVYIPPLAAAKTVQPRFARWKCTPSAYGTSPRESVSRNFQSPCGSLQISFACHPGGGGLLSASLSANLSRSLHSGARSSPFGGKVVRQHQKGCISLAPKARLACFPTGESPVVWFYHTGALHFQRAPTTLDPDLRSLLYCLTSLSPHMTPNPTHQYTRG